MIWTNEIPVHSLGFFQGLNQLLELLKDMQFSKTEWAWWDKW